MAKRYTVYKINSAGTNMSSVRSGSLSDIRDYCSKNYRKHKARGRVYYTDNSGNRYSIHSYRPIFVPNK